MNTFSCGNFHYFDRINNMLGCKWISILDGVVCSKDQIFATKTQDFGTKDQFL